MDCYRFCRNDTLTNVQQFFKQVILSLTNQLGTQCCHNFKQLILSPKQVNYKYNSAIISNRQNCRPNQSIMNIFEPQLQTKFNVAQIS